MKGLKYKCNQCPISYHTEDLLESHKKIVHFVNSLTMCGICPNEYVIPREWEKHLETKHRSYRCHRCLVIFMSLEEWDEHIRLEHQKNEDYDKFYFCGICKLLFPQKKHFLQHWKKLHPPIWWCKECSLSFPKKGGFQTHMIRLH